MKAVDEEVDGVTYEKSEEVSPNTPTSTTENGLDSTDSAKTTDGTASVSERLDPLGEARVRALAKTRVKRSLDLQELRKSNEKAAKERASAENEGRTPPVEQPTIPVTKVGWVDVPGTFLLEWKANPWRARPKRLAVLSAFYIFLYATVWMLDMQDTVLLFVVPILLIGNASAHLLPSNYIITEEGIYWNNYMNMIFRDWLTIQTFVFEDEMGELFFDTSSVRSRIQRGIPLYYPDNRAEVEPLVRRLHAAKWDKLRDEVRMRQDDT